jgi:hypothetical protein
MRDVLDGLGCAWVWFRLLNIVFTGKKADYGDEESLHIYVLNVVAPGGPLQTPNLISALPAKPEIHR